MKYWTTSENKKPNEKSMKQKLSRRQFSCFYLNSLIIWIKEVYVSKVSSLLIGVVICNISKGLKVALIPRHRRFVGIKWYEGCYFSDPSTILFNFYKVWNFSFFFFACLHLTFPKVLQARSLLRSNRLLGSFKLDVETVWVQPGTKSLYLFFVGLCVLPHVF